MNLNKSFGSSMCSQNRATRVFALVCFLISAVSTYDEDRSADVYWGIVLRCYDKQCQLDHDFVIGVGADPKQIRLKFDNTARLLPGGDLLIGNKDSQVRLGRPYAYQETASGGR